MYNAADIKELYQVVSQVVIAADKSPVIMKGAAYTANLFPVARYHVVNVINTTDRAIVLSREYENIMEKMAEESVTSIREILKKEGVKRIDTRIERGRPSSRILAYAERAGANLLVLSTHSKIGAQAIGLGRTARAVIERTRIPVLLFTPFSRERKPELILNPSSGTKYSFKAAMLSVRLAHALGASVLTLYIGREALGDKFGLVKSYASEMGVKYTIEVAKGDAGDAVVEASKRADLMVASRGRPGLGYKFRMFRKELALGKVEREVMALAEIPIFMIPD